MRNNFLVVAAFGGAVLQAASAAGQTAYGAVVTAPPARLPQSAAIQIPTLPRNLLTGVHPVLGPPVQQAKPIAAARAVPAAVPSDSSGAY
jgi:hypothetical protein